MNPKYRAISIKVKEKPKSSSRNLINSITRVFAPRLAVPNKYYSKTWIDINNFKTKVEIYGLNLNIKEVEKILLSFSFVHKLYLYDWKIKNFDRDIRLTVPGRKNKDQPRFSINNLIIDAKLNRAEIEHILWGINLNRNLVKSLKLANLSGKVYDFKNYFRLRIDK